MVDKRKGLWMQPNGRLAVRNRGTEGRIKRQMDRHKRVDDWTDRQADRDR